MNTRRFNLISGLVLSALLFCIPVNSFAQQEPSKTCNRASDINNLPVASTNNEYKVYCDISSLQCQKTLISQGQEFIAKYPKSQLCYPLYQNMVTAAIRLNDFDQAFELGRQALTLFPDHMLVMTQLATIASNQLLMGNDKYYQEGEAYARQAAILINRGHMPYGYMPDSWNPFKTSLLGDLYQATGIFSLMNNCSEDAASNLMHATEVHPYEPYTYFLLAKAQVQLYNLGMRNAVVIDSTIKQPETLAEQIASTYARASVLTENDKYKALRDAINYDMQTLTKAMPTLQNNLAKSIEAARNEMNALAKPPVAAAQ